VEGKIVTVKLNQQQLELIDRTIAQGLAPDRVSLMRLALREYTGKSPAAAESPK
jgi:Arc/MetJ-type ribon-helix-helix transcriptional regulator